MTDAGASADGALDWVDAGTPATWVLTSAILVFTGLLSLWAPLTSVVLLGRAGALTPDAWIEPWRLLSVAFVHGDTAHLALNAVVLVWVGRVVERMLGSARFMVLFTASVLGGALTSRLLGVEMSVGASGGLWGLVVACAVIVFVRGQSMPTVVRVTVRWAAAANLGINVVYSLQPGVDVATHLGGGVVGGLLMLVPGMLPRRLGDAPGPGMRAAAVVCVTLLLLAWPAALVTGQPWTVGQKPTLAERAWSDAELVLPLPETIRPRGRTRFEAGRVVRLYGSPWSDGAVIGVAATPPGEVDRGANRRALAALVAPWHVNSPEPGYTARAPAKLHRDAPIATITLDGPDRGALQIAVVALPDRLVRVEVSPVPEHQDQWADVALAIARGLRAAP